MTQDGHDFEWPTPDGAEPQYAPLPVFDTASRSFLVGHRWLRWGRTSRRRCLAALLLGGLVLLGSVVVVVARAAMSPAALASGPAPAWLVNRPLRAGLFPDMAPQCVGGGCQFKSATAFDLIAMRARVGDRFAVDGMRVFDPLGQLRGLADFVADDHGDELFIDAVWVPSAPVRWDGERALLAGGSPVSRWVLHTTSGIWLAQTGTAFGCGSARESSTLAGVAVHRLHAALLNL